MKYTIEVFLQKAAVELRLDILDLIILRWFIDFKDSGNMRYQVFNVEKYYWIFHKKLVQELPLLNIQKTAFYKNLKKMCDAKVLKKYIIRFAGTYTYYAVVENFIHLISTNNENTEPNLASLEYNFKDNYSDSDTTSDSFDTTPHATLGTTPDSSAPTPTMSKCATEPTNFGPVKLESCLNSFETAHFTSVSNMGACKSNRCTSSSNIGALNSISCTIESNMDASKSTLCTLKSSPSSPKSTQIINLSNKSITTPNYDETSCESLLAQLIWNLIKNNNPSFKDPKFEKLGQGILLYFVQR